MCARFELQVAALGLGFELIEECTLDVTGPRVVPLDQVAVVGVHDPDHFGKARCGSWMKGIFQLGGRRR